MAFARGFNVVAAALKRIRIRERLAFTFRASREPTGCQAASDLRVRR